MQERPAGSWREISADGYDVLRRCMCVCVCVASAAYPICGAEVDSLGKVVSLIEAAVIGSRKGDDKLPRALVGPYDLQEGNGAVSELERCLH